MALSDRDIIITPNRGASSEPIITLRGADAASSATMVMRVINSGTVSTLSYEGTSGQLFAVSDTFTGSIFSVNDVSGIPSIEVLDSGLVKLAEYNGFVRVGSAVNNENATSTTTGELQVIGGVGVSRDVYVGGGMTVVGTLNAAVIAGSISNSANVGVTDDPSNGATMYPTFVSATSGNQAIRVDSSGLVWIPSTNKLGIGTTNPVSKLHVAGPGNTSGGNIHMGDNTDGTAKWSYLTGAHYNGAANPTGFSLIGGYADSTSNKVVIGGSIYESNPATEIQFWTHTANTHATGGSQRMVIDTNGNVGIGTTLPNTKLDVRFGTLTSGSQLNHILLQAQSNGTNNSYGARTGITFNNRTVDYTSAGGISTSGIYGINLDNNVYGRFMGLVFYTSQNDAAATEKMRIDNSGNVGIGVTAPAEKLVVAGSAVITGGVYGAEAGAPDARIWAVSPANPTWGIFYNEGTPDFIEYKAGGTVTTRFALDTGAAHFGISGGFVGIGTDIPDIKLDVRGTDTVIQAREDGTTGAWRARVLSRNSSANKASFLGTYGSIPGVFAHNYALSAWAPLYVNTTNGSTDGDNVIIAGSGNVGIGNNAPGRKLDVSGVTNVSSHITQGALISRPNVSWGASGTSTGAVVIKFPGGSGNYGMVHIVIDIYTYDGENASTIIIGGHNWNSAWYSYGATRIGAFSKGVRVAFKDGQYAVVLGTNTSTWSYGQVVVRKIQNGSYYSGVMDLGGTYTIAQDAAAESYTWISSNLITTGSAAGGGWNSSNDGSGSGLDADLLDGLDSTAFLRRDVTNTMFAGQTSALAFENQSTFFRFAFNDLRFYEWDGNGDTLIINGGFVSSPYSFRAPIFYDSNDTNYYVDPNSETRLWYASVNVGQEATGGANSSNAGLVLRGNYNSNTWAHKFHKFDNGSGVPLYLSKTVGAGAWTAVQGWGSGLSYDSQVFGSFAATTSVYAPIYYDYNDSGYYVDPASTSLINTLQLNGNITKLGGYSPTNGAIRMTPNLHLNALAGYANIINWDNGTTGATQTFRIGNGAGADVYYIRADGYSYQTNYAENASSFRAPIFYDSNNTGYYVDPASTSNINNLTVNGTLTYSGTFSGGVDYAKRLDNATRTAISVGGNSTTYYPVVLQIGAGATAQQYGEFVIERGGYDDPGYTGIGFSTMNARFTVKSSGWGFGATYENLESLNQGFTSIANWQQVSESSRMIIWLRGATVYYLWNVVGNTTLVNANSAGGNIVESNPSFYTYTFTPTTTIQPKAQHSQYYNNGAYFDGTTRIYSLGVGANSSGVDGQINATESIRSPIFYDRNDTTYYVDPASGSRLSRFLTINGNQTGIYGNELVVGNTAVNYSLEDSNQRPIIQAHGAYPVLSLNHTVTSNGSHGPTVQFTSNGTGYQFVIGANGTGTRLDIGTATGNSWNPHNGIDNYNGTTGWRMDTSGNVNHLVSTRSPIYYDYNDTGYYADPASTTRLNRLYINPRNDNYYVGSMNSLNAVSDWQSLTNTTGQWTVSQFNAIGSYTNSPGSVYTYGSVMSWRTENHSFQLYASHTGDLAYKTQWNNDNYSGWLFPMVYNRNGVTGSIYGSIYYDTNDTSYYVDPASTSHFGNIDVASRTYTANYYDAAIEIREYNYAGAGDDTWQRAPRLGFHWGGRVASSIAMSSNGWINIMNNPGTGWETLRASQLLSNGEVTAYYSDVRLKTKVGSLDNAVEKVKAIETFKYVNNELANSLGFTDTDVHVGVSAQSVEAVLPEVVRHAPFDMQSVDGKTESMSGEWYKTVQYDKLVPLLIEAIKEQQTIIDRHRAELDELRELKELVKKSLGK